MAPYERFVRADNSASDDLINDSLACVKTCFPTIDSRRWLVLSPAPDRLAETEAVFAATDSQPGATRGFGTEPCGAAGGRSPKAITPAGATSRAKPDARHGGKREDSEGLARTIFFAEDVTAKDNEPGDRENVVVNRRRTRRSETMQET